MNHRPKQCRYPKHSTCFAQRTHPCSAHWTNPSATVQDSTVLVLLFTGALDVSEMRIVEKRNTYVTICYLSQNFICVVIYNNLQEVMFICVYIYHRATNLILILPILQYILFEWTCSYVHSNCTVNRPFMLWPYMYISLSLSQCIHIYICTKVYFSISIQEVGVQPTQRTLSQTWPWPNLSGTKEEYTKVTNFKCEASSVL